MAFDISLGIPYPIDLDIHDKRDIVTVYSKQYEKDARYIVATLYDDGSLYTIPEGATVTFGGTKRNTHIVVDDATIEDNKIYYRLSEQATACDGTYEVEFTISYNDIALGTPNFKLYVEKAAVSSGAIASTDEVNVLNGLIKDANTAITNANTATSLANTATTNANNTVVNINNETLIIWKPYVNTYSNIATTYPTPVKGWTTVAKDTGIKWRYNGTTWVNIGVEPTDKVGDLNALITTEKTDVVKAINENVTQLASITTLTDTDNKKHKYKLQKSTQGIMQIYYEEV